MKRIVDARWGEGLQQFVSLLARGPGRDEAQPPADPMDVGVHRESGPPQREEENNGSGLGANAGDAKQPRPRLVQWQVGQEVQGEFLSLGTDTAQRFLDAGGLGGASPAGRTASTSSPSPVSRTTSQVGNRSRSRSNARSRLMSLVFWERIVETRVATGSRGYQVWSPYSERSRLWMRTVLEVPGFMTSLKKGVGPFVGGAK